MAIRIFAAWCGVTSVAVVTGQHRLLYGLADNLEVPTLLVAVLTGATGLAWHEIAYMVARGLDSAWAFAVIPYAGAATGFAATAGLVAGRRWLLRGAAVQVAFALAAGGLALAVVAVRAARGYTEGWRIVALASFVAVEGAWAWHVTRHRVGGGRPGALR